MRMARKSSVNLQKSFDALRLPLKGNFDLTYRCNNNCRHCWLWISHRSEEIKRELSLEEIKRIVGEAKALGCRTWGISGGEPMLRADFTEILDYINHNSLACSLNTNGTLITPKIARLLKTEGKKMIALYGATAKVHDQITRIPGSFAATMRGIAYLKEAKARFVMQLIVMKENYHQLEAMVTLSKSLARSYRFGAPWLHLSAYNDQKKNKEILRQRLAPEMEVEIDKPDIYSLDLGGGFDSGAGCQSPDKRYLLNSCIAVRRDFHIDPYGTMSFCGFIREPAMRYSLKKGTLKECWEHFIPALSKRLKVNREYKTNCGNCRLRGFCRWCPAYAYLEHGRYSAPIEYLCLAAKARKQFETNLVRKNRRYYKVADLTICLDSELPFTKDTFHHKFNDFETKRIGKEVIRLKHSFGKPDLEGIDRRKPVYYHPPWAIYKKGKSWVYLQVLTLSDKKPFRVAVFSHDHCQGIIYHSNAQFFHRGKLTSLTGLPTDQVILARLLAEKNGCYLHSSGIIFKGKGLLFVGHSGAGKSTMLKLFKPRAEILCDDRMILRKSKSGFKIYGNWSHGELPDISANSAQLKAIFFLEKAKKNDLLRLTDKGAIAKRILEHLVKSFVTVDWWEKNINLIEQISQRVPCYILKFDKSGKVVDLLSDL